MNPANITAILQWLSILPKVIDGGAQVVSQIRAVLSTNGIDLAASDTSALDSVIADAASRRALALAESTATK